MTVALSFQPYLVAHAYGAMEDYDKDQDYPIWDDPDYPYSYYWEEDVTRKLTSVTRSYDDGTKYTATYQYNTNGDMIGAHIKETDGTSITIKREYRENRLIRSSIAEANASDKSQSSHITEYGDGTTPNYEISRVQYADKTTASEESWYFDSTYYPIKEVKVTYSYNQDGQETLYTKTKDGQPTERRETTITEYETTVTHTDGNGLRSVSRESYDPKTTFTTEEETVSYADGSSSYSKEVYDYDYGRYIYTISRKRTAEGTETYEETAYLEDGSQTVRSIYR